MQKDYKHMTKHRLEKELIDLTMDLNEHKLDLNWVREAKRKMSIIKEVIADRIAEALLNNQK